MLWSLNSVTYPFGGRMMSVQAVRDFLPKAKNDNGLREKLNGIREKERKATAIAVVKLANEAGFTFTVAEYDAAVGDELARQHSALPLDDEILEHVAGGGKQCTNGTSGCADT